MRKQLSLSALAAAVALSGCANMNEVQRGTATGAGIGAGVGAVLGAATGPGGESRAAKGAVLGGAAGAVIGNIWSARMERQKREMERATQGTGVEVTQTADNQLKLEIPSDISFATNRSDIEPNFRPVLDRFAATLNQHPATSVTIVGHTDSTGSDAINNPLSVNRAASTRDYLAARGVSPQRILIDGRGAREPVAPNNTQYNRAQNRRVEIYVAEPQTAAYGGGQSSGAGVQQQGGYGGAPQGGYGNAQGGYGTPQGGYGMPQGGSGNPQGGYGTPQGGYGNPQGGYGYPQPVR